MIHTGIVRDNRFNLHRMSEDHPEHPGRLRVLYRMMDDSDMKDRFVPIPPRSASYDELLLVHSARYINRLKKTESKQCTQMDRDTQTCATSHEAALLAAGGLCEAVRFESCEEWLELVRDLSAPINLTPPHKNYGMRWAEKRDLFTINALEGFVKETEFMEESLNKGDRCLLMEDQDSMIAFAWVTFRDFDLALWYKLKLPPGWRVPGLYLCSPVPRQAGDRRLFARIADESLKGGRVRKAHRRYV